MTQSPPSTAILMANVIPAIAGIARVLVSAPAVVIGTLPDFVTGIAPDAPGSAISTGTFG